MKRTINWTAFYLIISTLVFILFAHTAFANDFPSLERKWDRELSAYCEGDLLVSGLTAGMNSAMKSQGQNPNIDLATRHSPFQLQEERYGNLTFADRTRPIRMFRPITSNAQHKVSVSFRAPRSGRLSNAMLFWIYKSPHYAQGDGGRYIFELHSDDDTSDHAPGETVLARVGPLDFPMRDTWAWWPIQFPADLEEGKWYHVIFWNVHPSPIDNYASYEYLSHEKDVVPQGLDWVIWTKKFDENSPWVRNDDYSSENYGGMEASILLQWEDNTFWGQGYISAMADPPRPKIYGNNVAGEFFITDEERIVESITIRISRLGTPKDHIYIRLEDENSEPLFENTLTNVSEVPQFDPYDGNSKEFFTLQLTPPVQLNKDTIYRLILSSPNSDSEDNSFVLSCPVYSSSNTSNNLSIPTTILTWQGRDRGYLITSTNGGKNWNADQNADISFYFSSVSPLDIAEDINMDGTVDTLDMQLCVNVFLGIETSPDIIGRADINKDGVVDQKDMEMVIEEIIRGR